MATFAEKILAARKKRQESSDTVIDAPVTTPDTESDQAAIEPQVKPSAIEVAPVVTPSAPAPKRIKRRRVRDILLIHLRLAALIIVSFGLVGSGVVLGTIRGDLTAREYIEGVKDLPEIMLSKPCNFDHENGAGCKES